MRRLWRLLKRPAASVPAVVLLIAGAVGGVVLWGGVNKAVEHTSSTAFCVSCHEMANHAFEEYAQTVHFSNASGVRAECSDCHIPQEWGAKLVRKMEASKDLYHHLLGTVATPEKYEVHRLEMARRVWARMEANDSATCRSCHSYESMDFHAQEADGAKQMRVAFDEGDTCISCHKGVAHTLPDMTAGFKSMLLALDAAELGRRTEAAYAYRIKQLAMDDGAKAGRLMPLTEVEVLTRTDDRVHVRIAGWQQDGNDRVIFQMMGHRIFGAALSKSVTDRIERHESQVDPATDLTWHRVSFEAWTSTEDMTGDVEALNELAREMHTGSCSSCHSLPAAEHMLANQWPSILKAKERFITFEKDQYYLLQAYLQQHAGDVVGGGHGS